MQVALILFITEPHLLIKLLVKDNEMEKVENTLTDFIENAIEGNIQNSAKGWGANIPIP